MEIKNKILKRELNKWINETPFSKKVFDLFATFIELADEISEIYQFKEQELSDYMAGWPSMYLFLILEKLIIQYAKISKCQPDFLCVEYVPTVKMTE